MLLDVVKQYSDNELLDRLKQGDAWAFELIYRKYSSPLYQAAYKILQDTDICEDIVQDLFVELWSKRYSLNIVKLQSYLYTSARNNVLMVIRSNKIKVDIAELERLTSAYNSDELVLEKDLKQSLNQGLELLPEKCRTIFQMSRYGHLSHKEIASHLNISVKTVENQIGIALKRLKITLSDFLNLFILLYIFF